MGLIKTGVRFQGFLILVDSLRQLLVKKKGIAQIFLDDGIFRVSFQGFLIGANGLPKIVLLSMGNAEFVEKKGAVVFFVFFVWLKEGDYFIGLPPLVQKGGFFRQAVKDGELAFSRLLGIHERRGKKKSQEKGEDEGKKKKIGEGPMAPPPCFSSHKSGDEHAKLANDLKRSNPLGSSTNGFQILLHAFVNREYRTAFRALYLGILSCICPAPE